MRIPVLFSFVVLLAFAACTPNTSTPTAEPLPVEATIAAVLPTETSIPTPTATLPPSAALVNGEPILLSDFEMEYLRYADSIDGEFDRTVGQAIVLEDMIVNLLLAQGARANGYILDEGTYQARLSMVISEAGGETVFKEWMNNNHYTEESFHRLYRLSLEAAWMKQKIFDGVPAEAEQIRARQIMVQNRATAEDLYQRIQTGSDFATIAWMYDPIRGGELGWFPKNYLVLPEVEEAVFLLQPEEYTAILETEYGFQIIQVMERGVRPLTQDALIKHQSLAIEGWVRTNKNQSDIVILNQ